MSAYEQLSRQLDQAELTMREAEARLGNYQAMRPALSGLIGRAEAADGGVVVEWSPKGLSELTLDPRVMRMGSADLADAVKTALREAISDLREKTRAALAEAGVGAADAPSLDEVQAQLRRLREATIDGGRQAATDLDRAMQLRRESGV